MSKSKDKNLNDEGLEKILQSQGEFYQRIVENSPDAICVIINDQITYANKACAKLFGTNDPSALYARPFTSFMAEDMRIAWNQRVSLLLEGIKLPSTEEFPIQRDNGETLIAEISEYFFTRYGKSALQLILRDVTHRKAVEQALEESEARYKGLADTAFDGVVIHVNGFIESVNQAFENIFGSPHGKMNGKPISDFLVPEHRQLFLDHVANPRAGSVELKGQKQDGSVIIIEVSSQRCSWEAREAFTSAIRDITQRRTAEDHVKHQAYYDSLTDLPNRVLFSDRLDTALNHARRHKHRLAVLFIDLDRFKAVNDNLGHEAGDELLIEASQRLKTLLRTEDTVSRLGGDEFTILLSEINSANDIIPICEKILHTLSRPFELMGQPVVIGASIGAAVYPEHSQNAEELIKKSDLAMYTAKKEGRNQYHTYRADSDPGGTEKFDLERQLRAAIESDEFTLHYQPWVSTKDNRVVGAEALIRWNHPHRGLVFPDGFIDLAEDTRLIIPIGEWVLRNACSQAKAWQNAGLKPVPVSVNLSAWQLHKKSLVRTVDKALAESGLDPSYLHVEITETVAMRDAEFTMSILNALTARGVRIALDDFGKGYSSLSYLKKFPIHILKIDKSFVQDLHQSPKDQAIVSATIQLAHNLGLRVVAEGVENNSQLNFLKTEGADLIQGYLYAKPLPESEFRELLGRNRSLEV